MTAETHPTTGPTMPIAHPLDGPGAMKGASEGDGARGRGPSALRAPERRKPRSTPSSHGHSVADDLDTMDAAGGWTDVHLYRVTVVTTRVEIGDPRG